MRKFLIISALLWIILFGNVKGDTLHTIELNNISVHVQRVNTIVFDDSTMYVNEFGRVGNLYICTIERVSVEPDGYCIELELQRQDSTGWWYGLDTTICRPPPMFDIVIIEHVPDVNGTDDADISDLIWLIDYMFPLE